MEGFQKLQALMIPNEVKEDDPEVKSEEAEVGKQNNEKRKTAVLSQWTGLVEEKKSPEPATAQLDGLAAPTAMKVSKTLRRWQRLAMYGKPERANGLPMDNDFKAWYIEQRDRQRIELPEALLVALAAETMPILDDLRSKYEKVLGSEDMLVKFTEERMEAIKNTCDHQVVRPARNERGMTMRTLRNLGASALHLNTKKTQNNLHY